MKRTSVLCLSYLLSILAYAQDALWSLHADTVDPNNYYGVTVANGMVGMVSSAEPLKVDLTLLAGVYDHYGRGRTSNLLPAFNALDLNLSIGWEEITSSSISNHRQVLNMYAAELVGDFDFNTSAHVRYTYRALRHMPHNMLLTVSVEAKEDTYMVAENRLETPSAWRNDHHYYNEVNPSHAYIPLLTTMADSPSGSIKMAVSNSILFPEEHGNQPKVLHEMRDSNAHLMKFVKKLNAGEVYTFSVVSTLISSEQCADPLNQAERLSIFAHLQGEKAMAEAHRTAWKQLWESDIRIEGDDLAQLDVRSMLYHLYASVREGSGYSLPPMGLGSTGYNGHVFWDTEMFMFTPLLLLHPELAKELISYRFNRLKAARTKASHYGYHGAMYPWESAKTGEEECPVWALSGTFEHHITGCVAFAAWQYYLLTKDKEWLLNEGWPILLETAKFWQSRVTDINGKYHILNVVCADEWAENVNNNAFTNAVALINLRYACEAAKVLGLIPEKEWSTIADALHFETMDNGVTREHDSYNGQPIKQADVNFLAYPFKLITDKAQIIRDLDYYAGKVPSYQTPAMTHSLFALLYSRLGDAKKATAHFEEAYFSNLLPPFRVISEMRGSTNPYFLTGAGGVLQTVMMGFAGLDIATDGTIKQLQTAMPAHWKSIVITGVGKEKKTITVRNSSGNNAPEPQ